MVIKKIVAEWINEKLEYVFNRKTIAILRSRWAQDIDIWRDPDMVNIFHHSMKNDNDDIVDNKTWTDLKMWDVFQKLDRTTSTIGRQVLYDKLRTYRNNSESDEAFFKLVKFFQNNRIIRENIQFQLKKIESTQSYFLPLILEEDKKNKVSFPFFFHMLGNLAYVIPLLIFINPGYWFLLIGLALTNIGINWYYSKKLYTKFSSYYYLVAMSKITIRINKSLSLPDNKHFRILKSSKGICKKIKRRIGNWMIDRSTLPEGIDAFFEYLNMIALWDFKIFLKANDIINEHSFELQCLYKSLGEIDSAISVASYLEQYPNHCRPKFNDLNNINIKNVFHPLITNPISNSIELNNKSLLITGSNMSGKTTFMKTVGVNFILAQTIGIVMARQANIPRLKVLTSIKIEDDLDDGKSYYQVEVDDLLEFLNKNNKVNQYLFLIDEIYRGTNTVERISASTAVLKDLSLYNTTFVTTHDIELQILLNDKYNMKHFSECVEDETFFFDYQLKDGPCKTRNAIKLLELSGYPKNVVSNAYDLADTFTN